jgi:hypothetical protein
MTAYLFIAVLLFLTPANANRHHKKVPKAEATTQVQAPQPAPTPQPPTRGFFPTLCASLFGDDFEFDLALFSPHFFTSLVILLGGSLLLGLIPSSLFNFIRYRSEKHYERLSRETVDDYDDE